MWPRLTSPCSRRASIHPLAASTLLMALLSACNSNPSSNYAQSASAVAPPTSEAATVQDPHGSSLVEWALFPAQDWAFVQRVGGIAVGTPVRAPNGHVLLPIDCNVSGLKTITVQPTTMNSSIVCAEPRVRVESHAISITIRTTFPSKSYRNPRCPDADLGVLSEGEYSVTYAEPDGTLHPLGTVVVPRP